jgi:hypothetical protein
MLSVVSEHHVVDGILKFVAHKPPARPHNRHIHDRAGIYRSAIFYR